MHGTSVRRSARRRKRSLATILARYKLPLLIVGALVLYFLFRVVSAYATIGIGPATFYKGVYVNGVDLSGYSRQEGTRLMHSKAEEWLGHTYTLTYEDQSWEFSPAQVNAELGLDALLDRAWNIGHVGSIFARKSAVESVRENPQYFTSEIQYDEALMDQFVSSIGDAVNVEPVDAEVVCDIDQPRILTHSSDGRALDAQATKDQLYSLMLYGSGDTALKVDPVKPAISSDDANGGLQIIAQCVTNTSTSSSNRLTNVKRALDYFNALTVHDGERVSFNAVVGERSKARGFVEAPEYAEGTVVEGIGGGVCQASTTLYGALLMSGMDILQRSPHSMVVGYTQPSFDAAVTNTRKNLIFENHSGHPIYIYTNVTKESATVTIYGVRPEYRIALESVTLEENIEPTETRYEPDETGKNAYYTDEYKLKSEGKKGLRSECWRVYYDWDTGEEISRTKMSTDYYEPGVTVYYVGTHSR